MRIDEILAREPLQEMFCSRKKAEAIITALEKPINDHLLKVMAIETNDYEHWATELLEWLDAVAEIRLKPDNRPGSAASSIASCLTNHSAGPRRRTSQDAFAVCCDKDMFCDLTPIST